jgi:CRISPR-associated DxTHG motif protein
MTIVTICGLIGGQYNRETQNYDLRPDKAFYHTAMESNSLKSGNFINMLPLLVESYPNATIIALATKDAREVQTKVLEHTGISHDIVTFIPIAEEIDNEYNAYFATVNDILDNHDEIIIDLSHGFRHLPILTLIALILQNIQNPEKIKHIYFAQEIEQFKRYEIIDLLDYLELANFTTMLSTFKQNYTISNHLQFKNRLYSQIAEQLKIFSDNFLANSLKTLIDGDTIQQILVNLDQLQNSHEMYHFKTYIDQIASHLKEIQSLKDYEEYRELYELSKMMASRGYLLNAITLLFEAVGFYCAEALRTTSLQVQKHIDYFKHELIDKKEPKSRFSSYTLANQSRNIVKHTAYEDGKFKGDYLYNPETIHWSDKQLKKPNKPKARIEKIHTDIENYLMSNHDLQKFTNFIQEMERLRNNLAHGNSSDSLTDVKEQYAKNRELFELLILQKKCLHRK